MRTAAYGVWRMAWRMALLWLHLRARLRVISEHAPAPRAMMDPTAVAGGTLNRG
eukprot:SAG31_NODE_1099_length_9914_cov_6.721345_13_plen_54_part_00